MIRMPDFHQKYRLVSFRAGDAIAPLWVRIEDGRLGITRTNDRIYIPGFLLATTPGAQAVLDRAERPVTSLQHGEAVIENVTVPIGTWQVSLDAVTSDRLDLAATPAAAHAMTLLPGTLQIVSDGTTRSFHVTGGSGLIYSITATRLSEQ